MQLQTGFLLTSTDHLAQERREAAGKCVEDVVPDLSYSQGRDCIISHLPFPSTPNLHLSSQHPGVRKYFKMSPSL